MKQEAFWVTIYVAMFNITNGSTTEMSVKIGLLKIKSYLSGLVLLQRVVFWVLILQCDRCIKFVIFLN